MFNFKNSEALAVQQDDCIAKIQVGVEVAKKTLASLKNNLWIKFAEFFAPGNLVIRQWCLIDIISGKPSNCAKIEKMIRLLSYRNISAQDGEYTLWAEGYSYYEYTKVAIDLWIKKFDRIDFAFLHLIKGHMDRLDDGFLRSSYLRNGVRYPAPFGDLRDTPLRGDLQKEPPCSNFNIKSIEFLLTLHIGYGYLYSIIAGPVGLNAHIPKDDFSVRVIDGWPQGFIFYSGWKNKYKNKFEELADTFLSLKRWASIKW